MTPLVKRASALGLVGFEFRTEPFLPFALAFDDIGNPRARSLGAQHRLHACGEEVNQRTAWLSFLRDPAFQRLLQSSGPDAQDIVVKMLAVGVFRAAKRRPSIMESRDILHPVANPLERDQ